MSQIDPEVTREVLLAAYRRLLRIEDATKALLVGRLRDVPEEEMAVLWSRLVKAAGERSVIDPRPYARESDQYLAERPATADIEEES